MGPSVFPSVSLRPIGALASPLCFFSCLGCQVLWEEPWGPADLPGRADQQPSGQGSKPRVFIPSPPVTEMSPMHCWLPGPRSP